MKPETTNSYDHLKITQVELPPNLFVYGQPVNLHPAYNYDPANAPPNGFLPVFALQQPVDPLLKEDVELKNFVRRNGACFYYTLCILAILAIFGIIRSITMISLINSESRIPRIIIGFIVCDLIQDVLSIACLFPAKDAVYRYVFERMVLCVRMVFFCFFFYIIENIFYIIYSVNYEDRNDYDNAYLIINIIVGFSLFVILLASSRNLLRTLKRIKEIKEMAAARAHVQS